MKKVISKNHSVTSSHQSKKRSKKDQITSRKVADDHAGLLLDI